MRTKFSKTFTTWFFPVGDDVLQLVVDWVKYLVTEKLFGPVDPCSATEVYRTSITCFKTGGLSRAHWSNATDQGHLQGGVHGRRPAVCQSTSFRKTLAQLGERLCRTPEEFKAWSQNLGHEQVLTTFSSYGQVGADRQAELIRRVGQRQGKRPQGRIDR